MLLEEYKSIIDGVWMVNEDHEIEIESPDIMPKKHKEHHEDETTDNKPDQSNKRAVIADAIKPQVEVAKAVLKSIGQTAENDGSKKMGDQEAQIKNFEKQIRGACQQVVSVVEGKGFAVDKHNSSPRAYKFIKHSDSRDADAIKLAQAIITFYNSLGGEQ